MNLEGRRLVDGGVKSIHARLELQLGHSRVYSDVHHIEQSFELGLVRINVSTKSLEALGAVEDLALRDEVLRIITFVDIAHCYRSLLMLGVDLHELFDVDILVRSRRGRDRVIVTTLGDYSKRLVVSYSVDFVPHQEFVYLALDKLPKVEVLDGGHDL